MMKKADDCAARGAPPSKREKHKGKKERMKEKKESKRRKMGAAQAVLLLGVAMLALTGCQTADPASRSNRTEYGDIYAVVEGSNNSVRLTLGDGLFASADGGGDSNENTATQTTDTKPEVAVGVGGGSAGTGNSKPSGGVVGEAADAVKGLFGGSGRSEERRVGKECFSLC
jgi:hypothetical protein